MCEYSYICSTNEDSFSGSYPYPSFLIDMYRSSIHERLKKKILTTIGFHESSEFVVPFLE